MTAVEIYSVPDGDFLKILRNRLVARARVPGFEQWLTENNVEYRFANGYRYIEFVNDEDAVAFRLKFGL